MMRPRGRREPGHPLPPPSRWEREDRRPDAAPGADEDAVEAGAGLSTRAPRKPSAVTR
jgi:hypothetical protein